jgi:tripartite-type tricarboxylate transporter receptor subunit TctC
LSKLGLPLKISRRTFGALAGTSAISIGLTKRVSAQGWPSRYIRLIVPFSAGGGADTVARLLANELGEVMRQQVTSLH